jgi:hypothetical protein
VKIDRRILAYLSSEGFKQKENLFVRPLNSDLSAWIGLVVSRGGKQIGPSLGIVCPQLNALCKDLRIPYSDIKSESEPWSAWHPQAVIEVMKRRDRLIDPSWYFAPYGDDTTDALISELRREGSAFFSQFVTLSDVAKALRNGMSAPYQIVWIGPVLFALLKQKDNFEWLVNKLRQSAAPLPSKYEEYLSHVRKTFGF